MTSPAVVEDLLALIRDGNTASADGDVETFFAPGGCMRCGGTVWYPFDGKVWLKAYCRACGPVKAQLPGDPFMQRWD